jgi:hypothetical protein
MARRVNLAAFKERKNEENSIEIEAGDGSVFVVPAPECWPDSIGDLAATGDNVGMARALLGDDDYDLFVEAGGSAALLGAIVADEHGVSAGE